MSKYGYGPNGRALKKDGTERKARRSFTFAERMAQLEIEKKKYLAQAGKEVIAESGLDISDNIKTIKSWARDLRKYSTAEKIEAQRARLEAQLAALEDKQTIAEANLPMLEDALEAISDLHFSIGERYEELRENDAVTPENVEVIINDAIGGDVREILESANDPSNDPLIDYRRTKADDTEDDDSL